MPALRLVRRLLRSRPERRSRRLEAEGCGAFAPHRSMACLEISLTDSRRCEGAVLRERGRGNQLPKRGVAVRVAARRDETLRAKTTDRRKRNEPRSGLSSFTLVGRILAFLDWRSPL